MKKIFYRTEMLLGQENMQILTNSSVIVVGLGGVGSYAVEALGRTGIGHIGIVDPDIVEVTNINRQLPALTSTIGQFKTDLIEKRLKDINPDIKITKYTVNLSEHNQEEILGNNFNYVVDAIDSVTDKIHLIKYCVKNDIPIISSMGTANRINPSSLRIDDIKNTTVCPLARKVRKELRSFGIVDGVKVVYSCETPLKTDFKEDSRLGSTSFVPGCAGLLLASEVVKSLIKLSINYR